MGADFKVEVEVVTLNQDSAAAITAQYDDIKTSAAESAGATATVTVAAAVLVGPRVAT